MISSRLLVAAAAALVLVSGCGPDVDDRSQALASAVSIATEGCQPIQIGSGTVVLDGLILTAAHVIAGARTVEITTFDARVLEATPILVDVDLDIAFLRVPDLRIRPIPLSTRPVMATSSLVLPRSGRMQPASLIRRALAATTDIHRDHEVTKRVLELDVEIRTGDSGAAVIDGVGDVVGVAVSFAPSLRTSFAVDAVEISPLMESLGSERAPRGSCDR